MTTTTQQPAAPASSGTAAEKKRPRLHQPMRPTSATIASVLAVTTSAWALNPLLEPGRWAPIAFVVCLALGFGTAAARTRMRSTLGVSALGLLVLGYGLSVAYLSPPGENEWLPDGATLDRLGLVAKALEAQILEGVAPVPVSPSLEMVVILGIVGCYLLVELFAFGLRVPAWAGLPLLALWAPAIFVYMDVSALTFVLAAAAYLVLLAVASETPSLDADERRRRNLITGSWTAALVVVTLAVTPVVTALPGWGRNPLPFLGTGTPGGVLLSADLDVGESLGRQSTEVALRYRALPVSPGPLRLRTLNEFDGQRWAPGAESTQPGLAIEPGEVLWPDGYAGETTGAAVTRLEVEIVSLRESQLPVATFPRIIEAPGRWVYDAERDEVTGRSFTTRGMTYGMDVVLPWFDAEDLRAAGAGTPVNVEQYLAVADSRHAEDIAQRAREITEDADSAYDQALLLQTFLRSRPFEYSTTVPEPVTGDPVWDFLEDGRGYCVQFATAMTVMARSLGIPARMAVGFLPGTIQQGGGDERFFEVRGDRAHTWPELYFEGVGWVRFEPTPAEQSGFPPAYADPFANPDDDPTLGGELPSSVPTPSAAPTSAPGGSARGGGLVDSVSRALSEAPAWVLVAGGLVLLVLVTGVTLLVRRARARAHRRFGPESAWAQLRSRLAAIGITWVDSRTPRQVVSSVREQVEQRTQGPIDPEALQALRSLAIAVEKVRYAPEAPTTTHEELERELQTVLRGAAVSDPARRGGAPSAPRASS